MNTNKTTQNSMKDIKVNVKLKLASLWTSLTFLYIYIDYYHLYMPKKVEEIQSGKVFEFTITQGFLLAALTSMTIPILMIFLSVTLAAKVNRWVNMCIALVFIPYTLFNLAGEVWMHMVFGAVVECVLLYLIFHFARNWS
nr:DUF6326 family protein [uncultured Flavobacterium sp.]